MDAFAAPEAEDELEPYDSPWLMVSCGTLVFTGICYLLMGVSMGGLYTAIPLLIAADDPDALIMLPFGIFIFVLGGGFGVINFLAAWGLWARKMWGFIAALVLAAMYLPSGCMPFGAVLLYGLIGHEPTRKLFMK